MSTTLYRHFDSTGKLLYIGISLNEFNRFKQHMVNSNWSTDTAYTHYERFNTREEALDAERLAIMDEKPVYNKIHNNTLKGLFKRLDRLSLNISNDKNPITAKSFYESFSKRIEKWCSEYNTIKGMIDSKDWICFCYDREINPGHDGFSWVNGTPRHNRWKRDSVHWSSILNQQLTD